MASYLMHQALNNYDDTEEESKTQDESAQTDSKGTNPPADTKVDTSQRVFDYAELLSGRESAIIESKAADVEKATGIRVLFLTNYHIGESSYSKYCNTFFETSWNDKTDTILLFYNGQGLHVYNNIGDITSR